MRYDFGYGVDASGVDFKLGAAKYAFENFASPRLREEFNQFCEDNEDLVEDGTAAEVFVEAFENSVYYSNGIEAFLVACINDNECSGEDVFFNEDCCIYVPARIPEDDKAKEKMLTQERIREILARYLNPLVDDYVEVETVEIHD